MSGDPTDLKKDISAAEVITALGLEPHPEGGWYRQTWVADAPQGARPAGTAIYYLLEAGQRSHWHRVDADEIWHWYAGAPLFLCVWDGQEYANHILNGHPSALGRGDRPQAIVPKGQWQAARPVGQPTLEPPWTLVGCTVAPSFQFAGFELAAPGWTPPATPPDRINPFDFRPWLRPDHAMITPAAETQLDRLHRDFLRETGLDDPVLSLSISLMRTTRCPDGRVETATRPMVVAGARNTDQLTEEMRAHLWKRDHLKVLFNLLEPGRISVPTTIDHDGTNFIATPLP